LEASQSCSFGSVCSSQQQRQRENFLDMLLKHWVALKGRTTAKDPVNLYVEREREDIVSCDQKQACTNT